MIFSLAQDGDQSVPQVDARSNDASLGEIRRIAVDIGDFNGPIRVSHEFTYNWV